ncbi:MFS transporter [Cohnella sp. AR92]|uniref:MFS transporter n=1 Tax=Cohnella sp. AR92 TaxID=648716 RepID=UPI000F8F6F19|nr:MFS transporter [Cohnella sp. AR92]RUS46932.1 MFS transporter [Cohnella sp. AR92]
MKHEPDPIQKYVNSPSLQQQLFKRSLWIVVISQIFGGAGLAAGVTVGALLAQDMLGTESYAGIPTALFTLGSALAAFLVGRYSQRLGRRWGLSAGFMAGGIGAIGVIFAAIQDSVVLLFISLFIYGAGTSTNLQARYAGTDLAKPNQRAKAISIAMVTTTLGAVAGPNLVEVMGKFAISIGVPALAGPFILAAAAYILAGFVFLLFLRPDPFVVAQAIYRAQSATNGSVQAPSSASKVNNRNLIVGTTVMILTQVVMVGIMTMTPVHMKHHGHSISDVGIVIGIHIGFMFLPSLLTGVLVDKIGRATMSIASGGVLLLAGLVAALAPADSMFVLIIALALLGLGWNLGLISGTALIVDATDPATRAKTQGTIDVLIALAGASGGAVSGMVAAHSSYSALSLSGGGLALLLIPVVIWSRRKQQHQPSSDQISLN